MPAKPDKPGRGGRPASLFLLRRRPRPRGPAPAGAVRPRRPSSPLAPEAGNSRAEGAKTPPLPHTLRVASLGERGDGGTRHNQNWRVAGEARSQGASGEYLRKTEASERGPGRRAAFPRRPRPQTVALRLLHRGTAGSEASRQPGARPARANQRAKPVSGGRGQPKARASPLPPRAARAASAACPPCPVTRPCFPSRQGPGKTPRHSQTASCLLM